MAEIVMVSWLSARFIPIIIKFRSLTGRHFLKKKRLTKWKPRKAATQILKKLRPKMPLATHLMIARLVPIPRRSPVAPAAAADGITPATRMTTTAANLMMEMGLQASNPSVLKMQWKKCRNGGVRAAASTRFRKSSNGVRSFWSRSSRRSAATRARR